MLKTWKNPKIIMLSKRQTKKKKGSIQVKFQKMQTNLQGQKKDQWLLGNGQWGGMEGRNHKAA